MPFITTLSQFPLKHNWYLVDLFSISLILLLDVFTTCGKTGIDFSGILIRFFSLTVTNSVLPEIPSIVHLKHPPLRVFLLPLSAPLTKVYSSFFILLSFLSY